MGGPDLPFSQYLRCCSAARRSGHSFISLHFGSAKVYYAGQRWLLINCHKARWFYTGYSKPDLLVPGPPAFWIF